MSLLEQLEAHKEKYFMAIDRIIDQTIVNHAKLSEVYGSLYELVGAQIGYSQTLREYAHELSRTDQAERHLTLAAQVEAEVSVLFPILLRYYSRRVIYPRPLEEQMMEYALTEREAAL